MKLYHPITVDLYNPQPLPRMNAQQHNVGRGALITLTANGQVIVPDEEAVRIFAKRPDGNVSYLDCSILEGKVQADFTDQMLAAEGIVEVELELTTTETNITTPIFIVEVNKSNVKEGVKSSNEYKALEKYTAEAKEAAEQAQEVRENIPNYQAILKANSILSKTSGEVVTTTDSAKVRPKNIKLFGKGKQKRYEGNQLFGGDHISTHSSIIRDTEDWLTIEIDNTNGTDNKYITYNFKPSSLIEKGKQYLCIVEVKESDSTSGHEIVSVGADNKGQFSTMMYPTLVSGITITQIITARDDFSDCKTMTRTVFRAVPGTKCKIVCRISIIEDLTVTADTFVYEPFVGNAPSPSLEYPQEVTPIGEGGSVTHTLSSFNLLDESTATVDSSNTNYSVIERLMPNYDIFTISQGVVANLFVYQLNANDTIIDSQSVYGKKEYTFSPVENATKLRVRYDNVNNSGTMMMNYGDSALPYSTYVEEQPLTYQTPNGLHGIPLGQTIPDAIKNSPIHMSGVYWDKVEQQYYIGDTKNENGKDVQRVEKFLASPFYYTISDMSLYTGALSKVANFRIAAGHKYGVKGTPVMCDKLPAKSAWAQNKECCWHVEKSGIDFSVKYEHLGITSEATTDERVNAMKTYLTNNEFTFYHILAEPIITDTSSEELEQFNSVHMNYPNTTMVNDAGAFTEVEYVCDTKEHIKQNYTPNSVTQDILTRLSALESNAVNS